MFEFSLKDEDISKRVKAIIGIPDVFLDDAIIVSPDFKGKAELYVNKQLKELEGLEPSDSTQELIDMSIIYYICYLLCITMPVRLPVRMENISTKTLLQNIDWNKVGEEMLSRADDLLEQILEDEGIELELGSTFIGLSDETSYPNSML